MDQHFPAFAGKSADSMGFALLIKTGLRPSKALFSQKTVQKSRPWPKEGREKEFPAEGVPGVQSVRGSQEP